MDRKTKQAKIFYKLGGIIFGKKLTDWYQLDKVLEELNDPDLFIFVEDHAYLVQQWFNENKRK